MPKDSKPRETKAQRENRISKVMDDLVAKFTPSSEEMIEQYRAMLLKTKVPFDGGRAIGDLTRTEAVAYSQRLVQLAHMLNQAMPGLPEGKTLRRKSDPRGMRGQHAQHSSHAGFLDEVEDRNPTGVARRR